MPYSSGGKASASPVLSDSSTRKTSGSRTRKLTATSTAPVTTGCQLRRGPSVGVDGLAAEIDVKAGSVTHADDAVPLPRKRRPILLESGPVGRGQQLHLRERKPTRRRWHVLARRVQQQRVGQCLLADRREEPVHEQLGGVRMRSVSHDAVGFGNGRNAGVGEHEGERRTLGLE